MPMARKESSRRRSAWGPDHYLHLANGWDVFCGAWGNLSELPDAVLAAAVSDMAECYAAHHDKVQAEANGSPWFAKYASDPDQLIAEAKANELREWHMRIARDHPENCCAPRVAAMLGIPYNPAASSRTP